MSSSPIVWSEYQKAIFREISEGSGNVVVEARAGSAKTSSLLEGLKYVPKKEKILVVAFNKKIAVELQERAPSYTNLEISTLHSFGYRMVRNAFGKVKLDQDKSFRLVKKALDKHKESKKDRDDYETIFEMKRCISLCKGVLADTPDKIDEVMDEYSISSGNLKREDFIEEVIRVLGQSKKDTSSVDFDDMLYLCYVLHLPIEQYDRVFIDEVQDMNGLQLFIALSACKKSGRVMVFGDSNQVLYSWLGSDIKGLAPLKEKLKAKVLPLPISYRCASEIIKDAQKYVPDIQAAPGAKEGMKMSITEKEILGLVRKNDFVLSRTNSPLVKMCFQLWKAGIPATIRGKDLGPSLISLITQSKKKTIPAFVKWLYAWQNSETVRLKGKSRKCDAMADRVECLAYLAEGQEKIVDLIARVKSLFENKDEDGVVNLMTCHASKGLESNRVFLLMKTFFGDSDQEEANIHYVAITRAKSALFYVR